MSNTSTFSPQRGFTMPLSRAVLRPSGPRSVQPILLVLAVLSHPRPQALAAPVDAGLFTWTPYTASVLAVLVSAGLLRIAAYSNLGTSFTFHITKPKSGLKTTGVHRYVRHPS
ncbi:uncharacterized protein BDV17DRAFT_159543 [Aspergillus undulatus]|uniref:uncharacterized protein n=1 Tax=Aspergillus undulatus TaxID=1810928 RepID=UPI003CCCAE62